MQPWLRITALFDYFLRLLFLFHGGDSPEVSCGLSNGSYLEFSFPFRCSALSASAVYLRAECSNYNWSFYYSQFSGVLAEGRDSPQKEMFLLFYSGLSNTCPLLSPTLQVYLVTNTHTVTCLRGEGCVLWDGVEDRETGLGWQRDHSLCGTSVNPTMVTLAPSHSRNRTGDFCGFTPTTF